MSGVESVRAALRDQVIQREALRKNLLATLRLESKMRLMQLALERSREERDASIVAMRKLGFELAYIAELLSCSERTVQSVVKEAGLVNPVNSAKGYKGVRRKREKVQ